MRRFTIIGVLAVLAATFFVAISVPAEENPFASQTFLSDYTNLKPVPSKTGQDYVYIAPGADEKLGRYDQVMVDQPEISVNPASPYHSAKPDDLKAISEFMRNTIVQRLEDRGYKVVDKAGENVLYLRSAMTDMQFKKKKRGILAYTPIGAVVHGVKTAVQSVMSNVEIIDMAGQAEVADSNSGEVIGAMVSKRRTEADKDTAAKTGRMTFDEFKNHVDEYSDRLACRLANGKLPPEKRIDCTDPAARAAASGESPGK